MIVPVAPSSGVLSPLGIDQVRVRSGFWAQRQHLNASAIIPHCHRWMQRMGWIDNFRVAAAGTPEARRGFEFTDSDVYKLLEAMAWEFARTGDAGLDAAIDEISQLIQAAQDDDGYLNTAFGRGGQRGRYADLEFGHELYSYGHLLQAGVARLRTSGDDILTTTARRAADHVCVQFDDGGNPGVCGHPGIEMSLVELYRATGDSRYLEQARRFVNRRGHGVLADIEFGRQYFQDDVPIRRATALSGHVVRALYLACGAVDVAVETSDTELVEAVIAQYDHTLRTRTYLTGGMGSRHRDEAFGADYELPPDDAYAETCAGVASVMLAWRLLLATGEARYADVIERTLYNVVATSPGLSGDAFFYVNPLGQPVAGRRPDPETASARAAGDMRAPWFEVSCCPTNVSRTFATLGGYLATTDNGGISIHQYADAAIEASLPGGGQARIAVSSGYPWQGKVTVEILDTDGRPFALRLRRPEWASEATVTVVGEQTRVIEGRSVELDRPWRPGDRIDLQFGMRGRWTKPDPHVEAVRDRVAAERGPLVYCLESIDLQRGSVDEISVDATAPLTDSSMPELGEDVIALRTGSPAAAAAAPDHDHESAVLIPYHLWANRSPTAMRVWLPATEGEGRRSM